MHVYVVILGNYTTDQRVDQKFDQRLAKSHPPGQYLDIALEVGQYTLLGKSL